MTESGMAVHREKGRRVATRGVFCSSVAMGGGREERREGKRESLLTGFSILFERKASTLSDSVGRWSLNSVTTASSAITFS